ncbi:acyltransferase family protein [Dongia sp.]|uniref:acyltransferase family protein n=1 Tax=Dongia sp. TaxID=1977262 RepID=UPI0035B2DF2C
MQRTVSSPDRQFRPEIQGVRTIGAFLVAIFHIWMGRVSGGVDVFFVVSGFLITGSLYRQMEKSNGIDLLRFWSGLAKRLVPVAALVLLAIVCAVLLWLPQTRWKATTTELIASALYLENWQLMRMSVDYLARDEAPSPLQHFWALAVQGQFYIAWPFLLLLTRPAARLFSMSLRRVALILLGGVFLLSLGYSVYATADNQPAAYFNTFTRFWEFAIGGLLAVGMPMIALPSPWRVMAGWLGIAAVISCGFVLQVSTIFPGYAALWPTLGAGLVLIAGNSGSQMGVERVLGTRPLVALGNISYALYLWHWPVLVFYLLIAERTEAGLGGGCLVLGSALILAFLTTKFVEQPIRAAKTAARSGDYRPWRAFAIGAATIAPAMIVAAGLRLYIHEVEPEQKRVIALGDPLYPGAATLLSAAPVVLTPGTPIHPGPFAVKNDLPAAYADNCQQNLLEDEVLTCTYGAARPRKTIAIVGGSHSLQWLPALELLAEEQGWRLVTYTKSSCLLSNAPQSPSCDSWNAKMRAQLARDRPDAIFTTATHVARDEEGDAAGEGPLIEDIPPGFVDAWADMGRQGVSIVAIRDTPWMLFQVPDCVAAHPDDPEACDRPRAALLAGTSPLETLPAKPDNVAFIDLNRFFCDERTCFAVMGNMLVYRDLHHITTGYIRSLAPMLRDALFAVRPDLKLNRGT